MKPSMWYKQLLVVSQLGRIILYACPGACHLPLTLKP